ncbi:hypothetical protein N3930_38425, partial [Bacillus thuringiensis]|nr:hypothetical protein [Bacillus thuringiensis]
MDIDLNMTWSLFDGFNLYAFANWSTAIDKFTLAVLFCSITIPTGSRDYVDTERLTEFWFRFSTQVGGKV